MYKDERCILKTVLHVVFSNDGYNRLHRGIADLELLCLELGLAKWLTLRLVFNFDYSRLVQAYACGVIYYAAALLVILLRL